MSIEVSMVRNIQNTNEIHSFEVNIDNTTGTTDKIQRLVDNNLYVAYAIILNDPDNTYYCYIGTYNEDTGETPSFKLKPGAAYKTYINDLSKIYVRVPPGYKVTLYIIYER